MTKNRLEAFSDGVLAIIVTIMVLEMKVPHGANLDDIRPIFDVFLSYILSFAFVLIYWNNHHHLFQTVKHINGKVLWANGHLLFWLSLLPFVSGWMGVNHFAALPVLLYAVVSFMAGLAWNILTDCLFKIHDKNSILFRANKDKRKRWVSAFMYFVAICLAYFEPLLSCAIFVIVAILWIIPSKETEKVFNE
jgi:uncharacterized membrane protein